MAAVTALQWLLVTRALWQMLILSLAVPEICNAEVQNGHKYYICAQDCAYVQVYRHAETVTDLEFFHLSPFHENKVSCFVRVCHFSHFGLNEAVQSMASCHCCPQSTVVVEKSIQDLMNLMQDLSAYCNQFLEMVCDKLKEYKDICNTAYR